MLSAGQRRPLWTHLWRLMLWCGVLAMLQGAAHADEPVEVAEPEFVIIVHPSVERRSLKSETLHAIALGRLSYWRPGHPIQLILEQAGSETRAVWVRDIAAMTSAQFARFWIGTTFRGRAVSGPRAVPDSAAAVKLVEGLPGAIAIVRAERATPGVRVVELEPDEAGQLGRVLK